MEALKFRKAALLVKSMLLDFYRFLSSERRYYFPK